MTVRRSAHQSVRPSGACYFPKANFALFEGKKSSNNSINNGITVDDEVVASDVPNGTCFIDLQSLNDNPAVSP